MTCCASSSAGGAGDRELQVNVGSGNALFTTSDLAMPELAGNLVLGADYNSLLTSSTVSNGADRNG